MLKFVTILLFVAAASASPAIPEFRHQFQRNAYKALGAEMFRSGRIVGGSEANILDHPYMAALHFNQALTCGCSIVNVNTILSAAHCTFGRNHANFQVLAGHSSLSTGVGSGSLVVINQIIQHPEYNDTTLINDIVIGKLATNLVYSAAIRATYLPTSTLQVAAGAETSLAGWGTMEWGTSQFPDVLRSVLKPALSNAQCQAIYTDHEILGSHICSGEYGRDACQGDSGSALTYNGIQVGIVSWGYYCARDYPTVYARVSEYLTFIAQHS